MIKKIYNFINHSILLLSIASFPFIACANTFPAREPTLSASTVVPLANKIISTEDEVSIWLQALGMDTDNVVEYDTVGTDLRAFFIGEAQLEDVFPTQGDSFAILATGKAEDAFKANTEESLSTVLDGLNNSEGEDLAQLQLTLMSPTIAVCAGFDFMFLSEEFPEYVGSMFNDTFIAELGLPTFTISGTAVDAPNNFAFDTEGNIVSVNTSFGVTDSKDSTYDGKTPLLRATVTVVPGAENTITLSIMDLGDSIYDSAVFLDNFYWSTDSENCSQGAQADTDGDGLLDDWEQNGLTMEIDGNTEFLDLPNMGADPLHKDLFVEIDFMESNDGISFAPKKTAIDKIIASFENAPVSNPDGVDGIHLHVDGGSDYIMNPSTSETWGDNSESNEIIYDAELGSTASNVYSWDEFQIIKDSNFNELRAAIFRYAVFADQLGGKPGTSGIARGIPSSDFIVSLGRSQTVGYQAGTFMHELGHTLGLRHGGGNHENYKANYLSVMNYLFQFGGLIENSQSGNYDYSRYTNPVLNENDLDETVGLNGGAPIEKYSSFFWCSDDEPGTQGDSATIIEEANSTVDWNCDSTIETSVNSDINANSQESSLESYTDWKNVVFAGGAIGAPGAILELADETEIEEMDFKIADTIPITHAVRLVGRSEIDLADNQTLSVDVENQGATDDTYSISVSSNDSSLSISGYPSEISVQSGSIGNFEIMLNSSLSGSSSFKITATSQSNSNVIDELTVTVYKTDDSDDSTTESSDGGGGGSLDTFMLLILLIAYFSLKLILSNKNKLFELNR